MTTLKVSSLGEYIREQRESAQVSLRQLATTAGVSNPYLSQIERGIRKPSGEILAQIAKGLRISAETLYVRAGLLEERPGGGHSDVVAALLADDTISDRHRRTLIDIYESFRAERAAAKPGTTKTTPRKTTPRKTTPRKTTPRKTTTEKTARRTSGTTGQRSTPSSRRTRA